MFLPDLGADTDSGNFYLDQNEILCAAGANVNLATNRAMKCIFEKGKSGTFGKNPKIIVTGLNMAYNPLNFVIYLAGIKNPAETKFVHFKVSAYATK